MLQVSSVSYTPRPKVKKHKLVSGTIHEAYVNWQKQKDPEGQVELLEFHRHFGAFTEGGENYVGERWKVRFIGTTFVTHRFIRVKSYRILG